MHRTLGAFIILVGLIPAIAAAAQFSPAPTAPGSIDVAVTYAADRARLAPDHCGCFWLHGGTADAALALRNGFAISASIAGDRIANYSPGIDFNKITYLAGPRYTWTTHPRDSGYQPARVEFLAEGLFGAVHAFNGAFPSRTGTTPGATAFALRAGGGITLAISPHFGLRLVQADYLRTQLPNGFASTQNDLRLSSGLAVRFGR